MTIVAGFKCFNGVVICGDTQETAYGLSKRHVTKIKVQPDAGSVSPTLAKAMGYTDLAMAFGGAGDGPFIDMIVQRAIGSAREQSSLDEACERIEAEIKVVHQEYGQIFQPGQHPGSELIYGVKYDGASKLFIAHGPIVNEVDEYCSAGSGYYMADFLASRLFGGYSDVYQGVILAAYILHNAKEHVDGCGGQSHVAVLQNNGKSDLIDQKRIDTWTTLASDIDVKLSHLLLQMADVRKGVDHKEVEDTLLWIEDLRKLAKEDVRSSDIWADTYTVLSSNSLTTIRDELGFPKQEDQDGAATN